MKPNLSVGDKLRVKPDSPISKTWYHIDHAYYAVFTVTSFSYNNTSFSYNDGNHIINLQCSVCDHPCFSGLKTFEEDFIICNPILIKKTLTQLEL